MRTLRRHLSFSNAVALIALFVALGGVSYAAIVLPKNSVGTKQIKKDAVTSAKVADGSLEAKDFKPSALPATGAVGPVGPSGPAGPEGPLGPEGPPGAPGGGGGPTVIPAASASNANAQTTVNNSISAIGFDTESFDTADLHPSGAESRKMVAPIAGIYQIEATVTYLANATGSRQISLSINESGVNPIGQSPMLAGSASANATLTAVGLAKLEAGDYVVVNGFQNSGTSLQILGNGNLSGPHFSMFRVGPVS